MEENSEVPVDTDDVTFTSENAVQEVSGSHCDIETVVTVEKIKEEDGSPSKEKNIEKTSKLEKKMDGESTKLIEKLPQKDPPIKKIIIKAANKDYQIVKIVQKTPTKPDESQKPLGKDMQLKSTQSTSSSSPDSTKVSSNVETLKSPTKDVQQSPQKTYVKNVEVQKTIQKSPAKNTPADEAMEAVDRASTIREQQANASPVKEQPAKSSQAKETTTKVCLKDLEEPPPPPLLSTNNELFGKMVRAMELSKTSSLKEPPMLTTSNEMFHKKVQAMEPSKTSSLKEQPSKTTPTKEVSKEPVKEILKSSSAEEVSKVTPTKDTPTKATRAKEKLTKAALKEASTLEKQDREESDSSKTGEASKNTSTTPMEVDKEYSNDSQIETNSDTSEKEHNKSISRELRSLINSAKESKIISECTQLTSKTRKSRVPLDQLHNASLNTSQEADKIQGIRRGSDNSQKSGSSERSEKAIKRSMRSQNPEFVNKVKQFLNSVTGKTQKEGEISDEEIEEPKSKEEASESRSSTPKRKKIEVAEVPVSTKTVEEEKSNKLRTDPYCWRCHWALESNEKGHPSMICTVCPRSFHYKCLSVPERSKINTEKSWVCPECLSILQAESSDTRSPAMKKISLGMLCELLKYALERMMEINGVEPFMHPVDRTVFPDYDKYVVHPMDLTLMKQNIAEGLYGSTEAFLADAQWILHNSIIFNTLQSKLTGGARALVRSCRAEMGEIEACPECYSAAHARRPTWFTDVCSTPHILLWAKLKGFPFWPAKGMSVNTSGLVDVRFFGAHDRAWVPARDCFLYSEKDPNNFRTKRQDILDSMQEAEHHIRNISRKYGKFVYPPAKIQFDPTKLNEQLKMMIPSFEGEVRSPTKNKTPSASPGMVKEKSRSASKSSKGSTNDGETSESEDTSVATSRKMADGAEIAREEEEIVVTVEREKEKSMEVDPLKISEEDKSRKRRRSQLEEAVITIMDTSSKEKKKRTEGIEKPDKEAISQEKEESGIKETAETSKEQEKHEKNKIQESPKAKDNEPSTSAKKMRSSPGAPIRLISIAKVLKTAKVNINVSSTPKDPLKISTAKDDGPKEGTPKSNTPKDSASKATTPKDSASKTSTRKDSGPKSCTSKESGPKDSGLKTSTPKDNASKTTTSKDNNTNAAPKTNTTKDNTSKLSTPKDNEKTQRKSSISRSSSVETVNTSEEKSNDQKRRNSRSNKSLNSSNASKTEKALDKKNEKAETSNKEKSKEIVASKTNMDKAVANKNSTDKNTSSSSNADSPKSKFDDDTSLAVIARETAKTHTTTNVTGLPTITSVRSLSNPEITAKTTQPRSIEITIEATSDSSIFTPTSTENVRNMKEAVNKLQKLRSDTEPPPQVGRVGVRAFARMTSPPDERPANNMQVEIKSEPIDLDDADRQVEKMDLMNAFKLRPVNGPSNLREVRMNKVVVSSGNSSNNNSNINKRIAPKPPEIRPRAKKTFPQPKKADDGRSELNSKNSMVYIPIQPPMTQAPVRLPRPVNANGPASTPPAPRVMAPSTSTSNNIVNTVTPPLVPVSMSTLSSPMSTSTVNSDSSPIQSVHTVGQVPTTVHTVPLITSVNGQWTFSLQPVMSVGGVDPSTVNSDSSPIQSVHTVGQVPTTVHTVPLITSVNGQWTFSLQPVMSVGGVDGAPSPPMLNGLPERNTSGGASLLPIGGAAPAAGVTQPVAPTPPVLVPTAATLTANRSERDNTPGEPPKLLQRPSLVNPLDPNATVGTIPPPSTVGPLTAKLNQNAVKMTDFFRTLLEDTLEKVDEPNARLTTVKLQLEQASWRHQQQIKEIEHNHDVRIAEMRATYEKEKIRLVSETRRAAQVELEAAVKLAKSKQWCANCSQEAQFYCCWNTSYCDYPCQRAHWAQHYAVCTQQRSQDSNDNNANPSDRLQPPPDNLPKTTAAPNLTVGGKLAPSRVYTQDNNPKQSLIVSMVEDQTGNQSLKCVGTYKSPQQVPNQMSPLIINKQLMNNEEAAKKAVSSGGYIIVGAANTNSGSPNNTATIVTPSRRTHTIQYYN